VVPVPASAAATSVERIVASYRRWLVKERSLVASTVADYERYVCVFLSQLAEPVRPFPPVGGRCDRAVRSQCRSRGVGWAKNFTTVLRVGLENSSGAVRCGFVRAALRERPMIRAMSVWGAS
jgi:hypothetical protein